MITLHCWVIDTPTKQIFPVEIEPDKLWGHVKDKIKEKKRNEFNDIDADTLDLWKVTIGRSQHFLLESGIFLKKVTAPDPLDPIGSLSNDLNDPIPDDRINIIIVRRPTPTITPASISATGSSLPLNLLSDPDSPLKRSQSSPPNEIDKVIDDFLSVCRTRMRQLVLSANDTASLLPSWEPELFADATLKRHVSELRIPAVNGRPSLLLHNLGEEKTELDKNRISRIPDIFLTTWQHTIFINTAGSGKTRFLLEGLCQHWGFYVAADERDVGSEDFRRIVCNLTTYRDYERAKTMNKSDSKTQESVDHTQETASRALSQILLSRFLLLGLLVEEIQAVEERERLSWLQYRQLWVLLQAQPVDIFGRDLFLDLAICLRPANRSDLDTRTRNKSKELRSRLTNGPFYCVLDESQVTTDARYRDFYSENMSFTRPLLREIWRSWTTIFHPREMSLILSGTALKEDEITSTLSSSAFKPANYAIKRDIGAFDDPDDQAKYIQMYIPADWADTKWQDFLKRSWAWFRGRYRSTATLISLILEVGYQSPHRTINSYVEKFTAFRPTDADDWTKQETEHPELPAVSPLNLDRMSDMQATTLATALFDQVIYGNYSLQSSMVLDEPIAILAALNWVNQTTSLSHSEYLRQDLGKHSNSGNGFENYFAFYVRSFFEVPRRLAELFKFRYDFDNIVWKSEEFELVTVSRPRGSGEPHISTVTADSGPSSNIGFRAKTGEDILSWMSTNEDQFTFCLPPKHFGPDLLFFLRLKVSRKLLLAMVQCKNYSEVPLDNLITGVRTVTPDWLWKSTATKYKTAADSIFPQGCPPNARDLALKTMNALRDIPFGLTVTNAPFPILRVFASWPGDSKLDRSKPKPNRNPAGDEAKKTDVDSHPLATLHLENFNRMNKEMDVNWFRGLVERNEVIQLKRSASEDLDTRKWTKQQEGDEMVL